MLTLVFLFVIGALFGSFLNVLIYRTLSGEDWVRGRSKCDHCGKQIAWYDNIPLLSYFLLRGRCRQCKGSISLQYPVVESITGVLFVWWGLVGNAVFQLVRTPLPYVQPLYWLLIGFILLGLFFADLYFGVILTNFVVVGVLLSFAYKTLLFFTNELQGMDYLMSYIAALGAAVFFYALHKGTKGKGMGIGDVWYVVLMGFVLGWPRILVGLFISFVSGAVISVILMAMGKKKFGQTVPFGPFLVFGTFSALLWGNWLWGLLF